MFPALIKLNCLTIENVEARISIEILFVSSLIGIVMISPFKKLPLSDFALTRSSIGKPRFRVSEIILRLAVSTMAEAREVIPVTFRLFNKFISKLSYTTVISVLLAGAVMKFS